MGGQAESWAPWYSNSYALLIGASDYTNGWPALPSVPGELDDLEGVLERHGFEVTRVSNPDAEELKDALDDFIAEHGYSSPDDRLFVFFSGHGHTETLSGGHQRGYLVPTDAPDPRKDLRGFKRRALSMEDVETAAKKLEAKHALFAFDSCFSGTIFKTRAPLTVPPAISARTSKPVRQFITAGGADEEVRAESYFTPLLVQALQGDGDLTGDGFVTGAELGLFLHDSLVDAEMGQTPQYGKIQSPRLREGDFVFRASPPELSPAEAFSRGVKAYQRDQFGEAAQLYRQACQGGEAHGCTDLGRQYLEGEGVTQSESKALELFREGCDGGSALGCTYVGLYYAEGGSGLAQDFPKAQEFFLQGCDGGNALGCQVLGTTYLILGQSPEKAAEAYRRGCEGGDEDSCLELRELKQP